MQLSEKVQLLLIEGPMGGSANKTKADVFMTVTTLHAIGEINNFGKVGNYLNFAIVRPPCGLCLFSLSRRIMLFLSGQSSRFNPSWTILCDLLRL